jgi:acyl carrier protein
MALVSVDQLRRLLSISLGVDEAEFELNASLRSDLSMDDLDQTEIVITLEDKYGIEISNAEADSWETFGDIVSYLEHAVRQK